MKRIFLFRHAHAAWAASGAGDFERPLTEKGKSQSEILGRAMAERGYAPDLVLCSTARRAAETWEYAAPHLSGAAREVKMVDKLYSAEEDDYLELIRHAGDARSVMLVGHNPTIGEAADALAGDGVAEAISSLTAGFPKAGLAVFRISGRFSDVSAGSAYLEEMLSPKRL